MDTRGKSNAKVEPDALPMLYEKEDVDPLDNLLRVLRRWSHLIAVVVVLFVVLSLGFSFVQIPMYAASARLVVEQQNRAESAGLSGEVQGLQQLTLTMVELINSRPVAEAVVRELGLRASPESLLASLSVEQVNGTQVIEVTYEDPRPERAQQVVNAVGEEFSVRMAEDSAVTNGIEVAVWEAAVLPQQPVRPNFKRNVGVALILGGMVGVGLAFLMEHLFNRPERHGAAGEDQ